MIRNPMLYPLSYGGNHERFDVGRLLHEFGYGDKPFYTLRCPLACPDIGRSFFIVKMSCVAVSGFGSMGSSGGVVQSRSDGSKAFWIRPLPRLKIDPFLQLFAAFEEGKLFGAYTNSLAGFRIPAYVILVYFHMKAAESPDFNPVIFGQGVGDFIEEKIDDFGGL